MISEVTFSKKFTSFWNEILPNSKNYVRLINAALLEALYEPFEPADRKNNTALVNVIAFSMLREVVDENKTLKEVKDPGYFKTDGFKVLLEKELSYLSRFSYGSECSLPLSLKERNQIRELFKQLYDRYYSKKSILKIDPKFDGCGFINESYGDLICNKKLVEIKSGERKFNIYDIRQVLIYLVLNNYSKEKHDIHQVELFNPRMGIVYTEDMEEFCLNISALNSQELFSEIQKFIVDNNFVEEFGY